MTGTTQNYAPLSFMGVRAANPPNVTVAKSAPTTTTAGSLGDFVSVPSAGTIYQLTNISGQPYVYTWSLLSGANAEVNTINTLMPTAGNITIAPTAGQVSVTNAGSTVTLSLPAAITAPGSLTTTTTLASGTTLTAGTGLTVTTGAATLTNGNLVLGTAGNKILSTSVGTTTAAGANSFGTVTLVAGTATVATTAVTASSLIFIWRQSIGATGAAALGQLSVGTITAGTSFVINAALTATATSLATTDVSVVGWMIVN